MPSALLVLAHLVIAAVVISMIRSAAIRRQSCRRLVAGNPAGRAAGPVPAVLPGHSALTRHRLAPWGIAILAGTFCQYAMLLSPVYAWSIAAIVGLLCMQAESFWSKRRELVLEIQLASAIDLMIGALQAGASAAAALERAAEEIPNPLRKLVAEALGRRRLGDDPGAVAKRLMLQVPTESFRLFATTLAVHWRFGGSLAPPLAMVGKTIRHRIELRRRLRSLTAQTRVSTIVVLVATYVIALLMWREDPKRMHDFVTSSVGHTAIAASLIMQAVGIVWQARIGKLRF